MLLPAWLFCPVDWKRQKKEKENRFRNEKLEKENTNNLCKNYFLKREKQFNIWVVILQTPSVASFRWRNQWKKIASKDINTLQKILQRVNKDPWSLETTFRSAAITIPSLDYSPTQVPALLMASIAYSTWCNRPKYNNDINFLNAKVLNLRHLFIY
jgi:hypothetical protein